MFYVKEIRGFRLDENIRYSVWDSTRGKYFDCLLVFQADFIFLFKIIEKNIAVNKICISKVDYFLNRSLVKNASEKEEIKKHSIKFDNVKKRKCFSFSGCFYS